MPRTFDSKRFAEVYDELVCRGRFNEEPDYYPRYAARYSVILQRFAKIAPDHPIDLLDIGGGQLGLLCKALWNDRASVADIGGDHLDYLASRGVTTMTWNLCKDPAPVREQYDAIFFSEVIEHLPIPGHIVLSEIHKTARPRAMLICTTPNLYRLRNIVFMATGRPIFDHFRMPENKGLGHVLEYSRDHLAWQLDRAGWHGTEIEFVQVPHEPNKLSDRMLYKLGSALFMVPRFRDNLIAVAHA